MRDRACFLSRTLVDYCLFNLITCSSFLMLLIIIMYYYYIKTMHWWLLIGMRFLCHAKVNLVDHTSKKQKKSDSRVLKIYEVKPFPPTIEHITEP
ncbi:hypothetical protein QJS04_geneDACA013518 [Acorus gramineus]|uniref:ATP synthase F0 subunit 8 n=1 Tax=Acorus gramineus TaxID=55184 RepID=A0AAV9AHU1_ACOGR|nr:hypothetical protein QJS04_geneDACA013518 [Acorus gramineus]